MEEKEKVARPEGFEPLTICLAGPCRTLEGPRC